MIQPPEAYRPSLIIGIAIVTVTLQNDIFGEVEKAAKATSTSRASWRGVLSLNIPELGLGSIQYHLRAAKVHGDQQEVQYKKVDKESGKEVVSKEVPKLFSYRLGPSGERLDVNEIPYEEVKDKVRDKDYLVFAKTERRFFLKADAEISGKWEEIPPSQVIDKQETGDIIEPFDRTTEIEVSEDAHVPLERVPEYRFKEVYILAADPDKKVKESKNRVHKFARQLLERQTALVAFFFWGRGYQYYTAVIYPYERKEDEELWLLMGMSEGILQLDSTMSLEEPTQKEMENVPLIQVAQKPKVKISK